MNCETTKIAKHYLSQYNKYYSDYGKSTTSVNTDIQFHTSEQNEHISCYVKIYSRYRDKQNNLRHGHFTGYQLIKKTDIQNKTHKELETLFHNIAYKCIHNTIQKKFEYLGKPKQPNNIQNWLSIIDPSTMNKMWWDKNDKWSIDWCLPTHLFSKLHFSKTYPKQQIEALNTDQKKYLWAKNEIANALLTFCTPTIITPYQQPSQTKDINSFDLPPYFYITVFSLLILILIKTLI